MNGLEVNLGPDSLRKLRDKYSLVILPLADHREDDAVDEGSEPIATAQKFKPRPDSQPAVASTNNPLLAAIINVEDKLLAAGHSEPERKYSLRSLADCRVESMRLTTTVAFEDESIPVDQQITTENIYTEDDKIKYFFEMQVHNDDVMHSSVADSVADDDNDDKEVKKDDTNADDPSRYDKDDRAILRILQSSFWINDRGGHPKILQKITLSDVIKNIWRPTDPELKSFAKFHCAQLEGKGDFLCIRRHKTNVLVIVCPQNDFHDRIPESSVRPSRIKDHPPNIIYDVGKQVPN
jgi:hypothetical protein